jgi:hypothetical protein
MDWSDFFDELFTPPLTEGQQNRSLRRMEQEVRRLRDDARRSQRGGGSSREDLQSEIDVLHANFARALLLLQSLTTTLLRKQLITREELQAVVRELDLLDGQPDNQLDPAALPGMQSRATKEGLEELARRALQEGDSTSPRDFLKQLENRDEPKP